MGHYDGCREGYCGCGQPDEVVWACGREGCSKYHRWLQENDLERHRALVEKLRLRQEADEEARVTARQVRRRTAEIAAVARAEAEA